MPFLICVTRVLYHRTDRNRELGVNPALTTHSPFRIKSTLGSFLLSSPARWRYCPILPGGWFGGFLRHQNSCILFANTCVFQNLISYRMFSAKLVSGLHSIFPGGGGSLESRKGTTMRKSQVIKKKSGKRDPLITYKRLS